MFGVPTSSSVGGAGSVEFGAAGAANATTTPMDPAMMAAQMQAARQQSELDALGKRARADRIALEQPWKDPRVFSITADNVMFYFCQRDNPFFDPNSDNAMILMQNQGIGPAQLDAVLKGMTGIQFVLVEPCSSPLFVIRKQQRNGPDKITPLCHFYVLDGTVYEAPSVALLVHSRLVGMMDPLRCAFQEALDMLRFQPARGHFWEFRTRPARLAADEEAEREAAEDGGLLLEGTSTASAVGEASARRGNDDPRAMRATPYQSQRTHALLAALAERFTRRGGDKGGGVGAEAKFEKMEIESSTSEHQQLGDDGGPPANALSSVLTDFQGLLFASSSQQQTPPQQQIEHRQLQEEDGAVHALNGDASMHNGH